jgi:hypothetical protein
MGPQLPWFCFFVVLGTKNINEFWIKKLNNNIQTRGNCKKIINILYTLRKNVDFSVQIQVQYRKSFKNVTFSSTNHDLFLKKEHFFQIKNIFDSKKRISLWYWTWICSFFVFLFYECKNPKYIKKFEKLKIFIFYQK